MTTTAPDASMPLGKPPVRVAIADDHRLMLDGIKRALETAPDIEVVGEAMTVGRAAALQAVGQGFESPMLHRAQWHLTRCGVGFGGPQARSVVR